MQYSYKTCRPIKKIITVNKTNDSKQTNKFAVQDPFLINQLWTAVISLVTMVAFAKAIRGHVNALYNTQEGFVKQVITKLRFLP